MSPRPRSSNPRLSKPDPPPIPLSQITSLSLKLFAPHFRPQRLVKDPKPPSLAWSKLPPPAAEIDERPTARSRRFRVWGEVAPGLRKVVLDPRKRIHLRRYQPFAIPATPQTERRRALPLALPTRTSPDAPTVIRDTSIIDWSTPVRVTEVHARVPSIAGHRGCDPDCDGTTWESKPVLGAGGLLTPPPSSTAPASDDPAFQKGSGALETGNGAAMPITEADNGESPRSLDLNPPRTPLSASASKTASHSPSDVARDNRRPKIPKQTLTPPLKVVSSSKRAPAPTSPTVPAPINRPTPPWCDKSLPKRTRKLAWHQLLEYKWILDQEQERRFRIGMRLMMERIVEWQRDNAVPIAAWEEGKKWQEGADKAMISQYLAFFKAIRKRSLNIYNYFPPSVIAPVPRKDEVDELVRLEEERRRLKKERKAARKAAAAAPPPPPDNSTAGTRQGTKLAGKRVAEGEGDRPSIITIVAVPEQEVIPSHKFRSKAEKAKGPSSDSAHLGQGGCQSERTESSTLSFETAAAPSDSTSAVGLVMAMTASHATDRDTQTGSTRTPGMIDKQAPKHVEDFELGQGGPNSSDEANDQSQNAGVGIDHEHPSTEVTFTSDMAEMTTLMQRLIRLRHERSELWTHLLSEQKDVLKRETSRAERIDTTAAGSSREQLPLESDHSCSSSSKAVSMASAKMARNRLEEELGSESWDDALQSHSHTADQLTPTPPSLPQSIVLSAQSGGGGGEYGNGAEGLTSPGYRYGSLNMDDDTLVPVTDTPGSELHMTCPPRVSLYADDNTDNDSLGGPALGSVTESASASSAPGSSSGVDDSANVNQWNGTLRTRTESDKDVDSCWGGTLFEATDALMPHPACPHAHARARGAIRPRLALAPALKQAGGYEGG
ncbi:hypothetical protein I316_06456 [Kwoniella heveanensis BCC8398]|uniref:Uncharacterized protein n=1 Tax=Kwoniella heveanensis BCC8398 TaxID=1296120 RepID=A0A1B9GLJ0_9TREE|nr:hypothetical protein I316_06456 [Kwoniella heveanensis BCC8398]